MQIRASANAYPIGFETFDPNFRPTPMSAEQRQEVDRLIAQDARDDARINISEARVFERMGRSYQALSVGATGAALGLSAAALVGYATSHPLVTAGCILGAGVSAVIGWAGDSALRQCETESEQLRDEASTWVEGTSPRAE